MNKFIKLSLSFMALAILIINGHHASAQIRQEQTDMQIDDAARRQVIEAVIKSLNERYVFPEVAKKMEADLRARLAANEYQAVTGSIAFAQKLTDDLQSVSRDKHLRVRYSAAKFPVRSGNQGPSEEQIKEERLMMKLNNYGFVKVENLPGNIGVIDLRGFMGPEEGAETVAAAMNFVANSSSLIFDLRQNGGGDPAMVAVICSYLFGDNPVHLNQDRRYSAL